MRVTLTCEHVGLILTLVVLLSRPISTSDVGTVVVALSSALILLKCWSYCNLFLLCSVVLHCTAAIADVLISYYRYYLFAVFVYLIFRSRLEKQETNFGFRKKKLFYLYSTLLWSDRKRCI